MFNVLPPLPSPLLSLILFFMICNTFLLFSPARENKPSRYLSGRKQAVDETDSAPPPGQERCLYCGSVMSSLRLLMHQKHCAQSTFKCSICGYASTLYMRVLFVYHSLCVLYVYCMCTVCVLYVYCTLVVHRVPTRFGILELFKSLEMFWNLSIKKEVLDQCILQRHICLGGNIVCA